MTKSTPKPLPSQQAKSSQYPLSLRPERQSKSRTAPALAHAVPFCPRAKASALLICLERLTLSGYMRGEWLTLLHSSAMQCSVNHEMMIKWYSWKIPWKCFSACFCNWKNRACILLSHFLLVWFLLSLSSIHRVRPVHSKISPSWNLLSTQQDLNLISKCEQSSLDPVKDLLEIFWKWYCLHCLHYYRLLKVAFVLVIRGRHTVIAGKIGFWCGLSWRGRKVPTAFCGVQVCTIWWGSERQGAERQGIRGEMPGDLLCELYGPWWCCQCGTKHGWHTFGWEVPASLAPTTTTPLTFDFAHKAL